jgi:hypothetical protein
MATRQAELWPYLLHPVLDSHAEQQATQLSLLPRAYRRQC